MKILGMVRKSSSSISVLEREGICLRNLTDVSEMVELAIIYSYDAVLLEGDSVWCLGVTKILRDKKVKAAVILLTPTHDVAGWSACLMAGADDCQTDSMPGAELAARIMAVCRRCHGHARNIVEVGPLVLDLDKKEVLVDDKRINFTGREYEIAAYLIMSHGRTISRSQFMDHMYQDSYVPGDKLIDVFICKIRRKIKMVTGNPLIENVWGLGYRIPIQASEAT